MTTPEPQKTTRRGGYCTVRTGSTVRTMGYCGRKATTVATTPSQLAEVCSQHARFLAQFGPQTPLEVKP